MAEIQNRSARNSNIELYRIICMLMIVAHHFVVNSGLWEEIVKNPSSPNSVFLGIMGLWGKTGINCFMMITGYYMCTSNITFNKFLKLILWILFYKVIIYFIFLSCGYEQFSLVRAIKTVMPVWGFERNFTSCFIGFWLTIPFLNILINNINKHQHQILLILLLVMYTVLGSIPGFNVAINYVSWFCIIYFIASYIRLYPNYFDNSNSKSGLWLICSVSLAVISIIFVPFITSRGKHLGIYPELLIECNRFFSVLVAVISFIYFKNINIKTSKLINTIAASTFGVLLIHTNSDAMRHWLWYDIFDCINCINMSFGCMIVYFLFSVLLVFSICTLLDIFRSKFVEPYYMKVVYKCLSNLKN